MRTTERIEIISKIGRELQARWTFDQIDDYLLSAGIELPSGGRGNSKWVYVRSALARVDETVVARIADDLGMGGSVAALVAKANPPAFWSGTTDFRLFISHLSKDKDKAKRLKDCLALYGVRGFLAHDDIEPTKAWLGEIERALHCMDALLAVLTPGFSQSNWTQQEVGFAIGRGAKVISFMMGETPTGFVSAQQGLAWHDRSAEVIASEIVTLLQADPATSDRMTEALPKEQAGFNGVLADYWSRS